MWSCWQLLASAFFGSLGDSNLVSQALDTQKEIKICRGPRDIIQSQWLMAPGKERREASARRKGLQERGNPWPLT